MTPISEEDFQKVDSIISYYEKPKRPRHNFSKIGDFCCDDKGNWWICNKIVAGKPVYTRLTPNEQDKPGEIDPKP